VKYGGTQQDNQLVSTYGRTDLHMVAGCRGYPSNEAKSMQGSVFGPKGQGE
jgi:hypothetical protein